MNNDFPISVRPADRQDLAAINRLVGYALANSPLDNRKKHSLLPSLLFTIDQFEDHDLLLAVRRAEIIGVIAMCRADNNQPATIESLYVLPLIQHQGIGKLLVGEASRMLEGEKWQVSADSAAHFHLERGSLRNLLPANDELDPTAKSAA